MEWLSQNWVWVLFFVGFIAMHLFGHAGHGGLGGSRHNRKTAGKDNVQSPSEQGTDHQH